MTPDDPRHGSRAGYQAHKKDDEAACDACLRGRARQDKTRRIERHRGVRTEYTPAEVFALIEPWLALGLSCGAIGNAAGLGGTHGSRLAERITDGHPFRRATYEALTRVTEDDFHGTAVLWAALTRQRVYSLMAAGHRLIDIPILPTGQWRHRDNVTVDQARKVRDYYARHQHTTGACRHTASKTHRKGHQPPAAWDDPGTLAWPLGWTEPLQPHAGADLVVVQRVLDGDWRLPTSKAEKTEIAAQWYASGRPLAQLGRLVGWKIDRYFKASDVEAGEAA